ncbi:thiamine-phosphate pyrophosphorylase [Thermanaerovibrio velox DSM 12556]|uniref:Thiamine-phosphate synthase n=1 Tax=Thermanaerovibrio velox DSM 12556 TaxID=926567 RepID=H0UN21_9BACT|nr:thiamine phosphate synthase [Thermanaerovibrio velox]EHM09300.1 thiamine-phosphate pyrophosphorylase [Thermanaerovibrio velox DSM 12556]
MLNRGDLGRRLAVYGILDSSLGGAEELVRLGALGAAKGVKALQLRCKGFDGMDMYRIARDLVEACGPFGCLILVNDRLDVALAAKAHGVHLGHRDIPIGEARRIAPEGFIIGATARTPEEAARAEADGASYIGSGAAFPSSTKNDTVLIGPSGIARVARAVRIPCVAIGGINEDNLRALEGTGIAGIAMCGGLFGAGGMRGEAIAGALEVLGHR